jgi:hypothetical protein
MLGRLRVAFFYVRPLYCFRVKQLLDSYTMTEWRKLMIKYQAINWLLIAAILLITLLPAHYHLHHLVNGDATSHSHNVDLHIAFAKAEESHHHTDVDVFAAAPDGIRKNTSPAFSPFLLLAIWLVLLPISHYRIISRPDYGDTRPKQIHPHLSPPLRAPPCL